MEIAHNSAIDFQLQQLYHAMGLALALNRTLVMPAMLCLCARGWYPNDACRLAGDTVSTLPFRCTGDQVSDTPAVAHCKLHGSTTADANLFKQCKHTQTKASEDARVQCVPHRWLQDRFMPGLTCTVLPTICALDHASCLATLPHQ